MLLLVILSYYRLFHLELLLSIVDYFSLNYFWQFKVILNNYNIWLLMAIDCSFVGAIGGY
jgi:hypothetical protein